MSKYDPALFMYFDIHTALQGLLLAHVDDLIHGAGTSEFEATILEPLKQRFTFGREDEEDFFYVGLHVQQLQDTIIVDQDSYVDSLEIPEFSGGHDLHAILDEEGQAAFRAVVGRIGWVAGSSRPDLSYDNLVLSMKVGKATGGI